MRSGLVVLLLVRASAAQGAPSPWDTAVCNQVHDGSSTNNATAGGCWQMADYVNAHNNKDGTSQVNSCGDLTYYIFITCEYATLTARVCPIYCPRT